MSISDDRVIIEDFNKIISDTESSGWDYWRQYEVRDGFRFFYGLDQWDESVKANLHSKGLKEITLNRIPPFIKSVQGEIIKFSGETHFFPTDGESAKEYAEITNEGTKWIRDQANSEYYNKDVLQDALICGLGVVESIVDHDTNPDGLPADIRVPPIEALPDWNGMGANLSNGRYFIRAKFLSKNEFSDMFPDVAQVPEEGTDARFTLMDIAENDDDIFENKFQLKNNQYNKKGQEILVFDFQFKEKVAFKRVQNPIQTEEVQLIAQNPFVAKRLSDTLQQFNLSPSEQIWNLDTTEFKALKEKLSFLEIELEAQDAKKDEYFRAWVSKGKVIQKGDAPYKDRFSYQMMLAFWDDEKQCPYGYLRMLKDAQKVSNSAFMHLFHSTLSAPKPVVFYEETAIDDADEFERDISNRQAAIGVRDGAITQGKIQPFTPPPVPTGFELPLTIANSAFVDVTGINLNFAAMEENVISGVLDRQRNEKSATSLGSIVDNFRFFLKSKGFVDIARLAILAENMPGRLVSVLGKEGIQQIPLLKDVFRANYEIKVDEAKPSVTQSMETTKQLAEMLKAGFIPQEINDIILKFIFENSGMPQTAITEIGQRIQQSAQRQQQQSQQQAEASQRLQQITEQGLASEAMANQALAQDRNANIPVKEAEANKKFAEAQQKELENAVILAGNTAPPTFAI